MNTAATPLTITVDGALLQVTAGVSLAAALALRPPGTTRRAVDGALRAPLCGMGVCHECRVEVDGQRRLACQTPCAPGMQVITGAADPALPDDVPHAPPGISAARHCDLLIIGAGPAGLAAALAAAPSGAAIVLVDDNPAPGGQIWRAGPQAQLPAQAHALREQLQRHANIRWLGGTRVVGLGPAGTPGQAPALLLENAEQGWLQTSGRLILCTGARELLLPFAGWTLPGVTGAGGLQALIKAGLAVRGERIVVAGSGPLLLAAAHTARQAGAQVLRIAEQTRWPALLGFAAQLPRWPAKAAQAASLASPALRVGWHVAQAHGDDRLAGVTLTNGAAQEAIACDRLACGFGLVPNTQLGQLLGCALNAHQGLQVDTLQATGAAQVWAAGECTGFGGSEKALAEGAIAGHAAVGELHVAQALTGRRLRWQGFADALRRSFALDPALRQLPQADTLVCRCEDVAHGQLAPRSDWIDAKLHTRCGMGACQGRVCGAAAQFLYGWTPAPAHHLLAPARLATLAGMASSCDAPVP